MDGLTGVIRCRTGAIGSNEGLGARGKTAAKGSQRVDCACGHFGSSSCKVRGRCGTLVGSGRIGARPTRRVTSEGVEMSWSARGTRSGCILYGAKRGIAIGLEWGIVVATGEANLFGAVIRRWLCIGCSLDVGTLLTGVVSLFGRRQVLETRTLVGRVLSLTELTKYNARTRW